MLIERTEPGTPILEFDAAFRVSRWLESVFRYDEDRPRTDGKPPDCWPTRAQLEEQIKNHGGINGDCDDHAFAAVYALADLGIRARVVLCWTEAPKNLYHAVCETQSGWVIDNRSPGQVVWWTSPLQSLYLRDRMSGFFEFGEVAQWTFIDLRGAKKS